MFKLDSTAMVLVDIQERLAPAISNIDECNENVKRLLQIANELAVSLIVTEQYPRGLGNTVPELKELLNEKTPIIEKTTFSCFGEPLFCKEVSKKSYKTIILFGIETHVCIFQTALDAKKKGLDVILIADAVSSRTEQNKGYALDAMRQEGIKVISTEMFLFMALKDAKHPSFKTISKLLK